MSKNQGSARSKEEILQIIREWQQSGLSKKVFCEQKQINYQTFIGWGVQHRNGNKPAGRGFVQVEIPKHASGVFAELHLERGKKIILHHPVTAEVLVTLLKC